LMSARVQTASNNAREGCITVTLGTGLPLFS
jgi:hypothetical protein